MNRLAAYSVMALAVLLGGGSMVLFGAFLIMGPFTLVRFASSEAALLSWDAVLSLLFFVQHSGMVRTSFRNRLSLAFEGHFHAAIYAILSGVALTLVVVLWQTSQTVLLQIPESLHWLPRAISLLAMAGFMWALAAFSTFDPFGRLPLAARLKDKPLQPPSFMARGPYLWVRHPFYFFILLLIWSTPVLTLDRLLFNVLWTLWIVLGTHLEEKDLVREFGETYRRYQQNVPMLLPWRGRWTQA
jgi:protein-S-isoprenylcysteine O-methyltransferase Ste14